MISDLKPDLYSYLTLHWPKIYHEMSFVKWPDNDASVVIKIQLQKQRCILHVIACNTGTTVCE